MRELVTAELEPLVRAQIAKAQGVRHFLLRNKKTGKFERVTDPDRIVHVLNASAQHEVWELWTRDPDTSAFADLLNRALDKPKEQSFEVNLSGKVELGARLEEARERARARNTKKR